MRGKKFFTATLACTKRASSLQEGYIVRAKSDDQYGKIFLLTTILGLSCEVSSNNPALKIYNSNKGLVYVTEYDVTDYTSFEEGLKKRCIISNVVQAF